MLLLLSAFLIFLPAAFAFYVGLTQSVQAAFLKVYIPTLFLLPGYYYFDPPVLPGVDFNQSAMLALFFIWLIRGFPGWWFSFTDILVFSFVGFVGFSEYQTSGYKDAQNLIFANLVSVLFPYLIAKSLIEPFNLRVPLVKQIVIYLVIVSLISLSQFVLKGWSIWHRVFGRFFAGQGWQWVPQERWGFGRITGPYGHAILAGIVFAVGYRLQRWLEWSGEWPKRWHKMAWWPLPLGLTLTLILLMGMFMTLSRGPWIGAFLAAFVVLIGRFRWRWMAVITILISSIILTPVAIERFADYVEELGRSATEHTEQTLVYRWELLSTYIELGKEHLYLGWGRLNWPKIPGQRSVDNHYLLFFLMHGIIAVGLLALMMVLMPLRLLFHDMRLPIAQPPGSGFGFTLASLYVIYGWSIGTVFMGEQTLPLFFILLGWSEGYLRYEKIHRQHITLAKSAENAEHSLSISQAKTNPFKRILK
jgi:hypothetical protein